MSAIANDPAFLAALDFSLRGEYAGAVAALEAAIARHPNDADGPLEYGLLLQRQAENILPPAMLERDGSGIIGKLASSYLGLGVVVASKALGQTDWIVQYRDLFERSLLQFDKAIAIAPNDPRAHHAKALSLRYLGKTGEAAQSAARAAALEPQQEEYAQRAAAFDTAAGREARARPAVDNTIPGDTWNDVILPEKTKRELRQTQLLLEKPDIARDLGIEPPTGLLLYGPPGTGKTTIARILAHESHCHFIATSPADINSMWLGESEKAVKRLFDEARAKPPAIIFLDEIDALLPSRSGGINQYSDKVVNQFLHEMDGLKRNRGIFVIGATNRRDMLDPALLRGGRLSREIEIPLPDLQSRKALFALSTRTAMLDEDVNLDDLATRTEGHSGANIKALVNEAGLQALIRLADSPHSRRTVTRADFEIALTNYTPPAEDEPNGWRLFG